MRPLCSGCATPPGCAGRAASGDSRSWGFPFWPGIAGRRLDGQWARGERSMENATAARRVPHYFSLPFRPRWSEPRPGPRMISCSQAAGRRQVLSRARVSRRGDGRVAAPLLCSVVVGSVPAQTLTAPTTYQDLPGSPSLTVSKFRVGRRLFWSFDRTPIMGKPARTRRSPRRGSPADTRRRTTRASLNPLMSSLTIFIRACMTLSVFLPSLSVISSDRIAGTICVTVPVFEFLKMEVFRILRGRF